MKRPQINPSVCLGALKLLTRIASIPALTRLLVILAICTGPVGAEGSGMLVEEVAWGSGLSLEDLTVVNGRFYFTGDDGLHGRELWTSDGTPEGTLLLKDILPGIAGSNPMNLTNVDGTLFFTADNWLLGRELWMSDGTPEGTVLVKDIGWLTGSEPAELTNVNGTLFFAARHWSIGEELWISDGTPEGTVLVRDINTRGNGSPRELTNANGTLYFRANDGRNGEELWKSNGTAAGTLLVKDISWPFDANVRYITDLNGKLFFTASDLSHGAELWTSDGTPAGTMLVKDLIPGPGASQPSELTEVNGILFFAAHDGLNGRELWRSDGTAAGTVLVKDIHPDAGSVPQHLTAVNGRLFFTADDGVHGRELWRSDGTAVGTVRVSDIRPGEADTYPDLLTSIEGQLFFRVDDGVHGRELWTSDGTEAGTVLVQDIHPTGGSDPRSLTSANGTLYFTADDGIRGRALWTLSSLRIARGNEPGSLLVFPLIDNLHGMTFVNIVNAGDQDAILECYMVTRGPDGGVDEKDNFIVRLTQQDKLTWASHQPYDKADTPLAGFAQRVGYLFCWAIDDPASRMEIDYDFLRGDATVVNLATASSFHYNAIPSQMIRPTPDRVLHLDSKEYTAGSSRILFEGLAAVPGAISGRLVVANPGIDFLNAQQPQFDIDLTCWNESETQYSRSVVFKDFAQYDLRHDLYLDMGTIFSLGFHCETASTHALWAVFQQNLGTVFSWGGNLWHHADAAAVTEIRLP